MTRILSLGQNNGLTVMILNLAPLKSYHLDTLSSLNFANRTKKIEVREVENEPVFKGCSRAVPTFTGPSIQRQPLRPLASVVNPSIHTSSGLPRNQSDKQPKAFSVYSDKDRHSNAAIRPMRVRSPPLKRPSDPFSSAARPSKRRSPDCFLRRPQPTISKELIEDMIERKVSDILATRALDQPSIAPQPDISEEVQRRLELLEQKIEGQDDSREQGLTFLLMAKQHAVRGEDTSALRMYTLAKDFFPDNKRLEMKIAKLRTKTQQKKQEQTQREPVDAQYLIKAARLSTGRGKQPAKRDDDADYHAEEAEEAEEEDEESDRGFNYNVKASKKGSRLRFVPPANSQQTPRTKLLLEIVNTRDINRIRLLKGVGAKKAETILEALCAGDEETEGCVVQSLGELGNLKGVGAKTGT